MTKSYSYREWPERWWVTILATSSSILANAILFWVAYNNLGVEHSHWYYWVGVAFAFKEIAYRLARIVWGLER